MKLDRIFSFLVPKDHKFFPLFIVAVDNLVYTSELLVALFEEVDLDKRQQLIFQINEAKQTGVGITKRINAELNHSFITPFERGDIHALVYAMDRIVDHLYSASKRVQRYKLPLFPEEFVQMAGLILSANREIQHILHNVHTINDFQKYIDSCQRIGEMESQVDDLYQQYLATLFEQETCVVDLIKKRDIATSLEKAIDKCDDISGIFYTIIVKMA
jgi:hypothetical protein